MMRPIENDRRSDCKTSHHGDSRHGIVGRKHRGSLFYPMEESIDSTVPAGKPPDSRPTPGGERGNTFRNQDDWGEDPKVTDQPAIDRRTQISTFDTILKIKILGGRAGNFIFLWGIENRFSWVVEDHRRIDEEAIKPAIYTLRGC
jgi:hypothetical protein